MKTSKNITTTATSSQSCEGDWLWTPTKNIPDSACNMEITACWIHDKWPTFISATTVANRCTLPLLDKQLLLSLFFLHYLSQWYRPTSHLGHLKIYPKTKPGWMIQVNTRNVVWFEMCFASRSFKMQGCKLGQSESQQRGILGAMAQ